MILAKYSSLYSILLLALWGQVNSEPTSEVTVIRQGYVKGRYSETRSGRIFAEYFGIPFGHAGRFELAKPGNKWDGILDGTYRRPPCMHQQPSKQLEGVEDCLFINVHTPKIHRKYNVKGLPVIAVIHGGFNHWEDQTGHFLGAKYFLDEDVVIVSFNYRLGPFGFLTTSDNTMHANLGLKDQVLALKWIQKNIAFFGGDPRRVTLAGYGAGAASVTLHLMSPMSTGLFTKAIAQSGTSLCPWSLVEDPDQTLDQIALKLKCSQDMSGPGVIKCLKDLPAVNLARESAETGNFHSKDREKVGNVVLFGPVVEHWMRNWPTQHIFLPNYPQNLFANYSKQTMSPVQLLIGINEYDGVTQDIAQASIISKDLLNYITPDKFSQVFGYTNKVNATKLPEIEKKIMDHYFPKVDKATWKRNRDPEVGRKLFQALTHRNFAQCTRVFIKNHAKHATVFPYFFLYHKNVSFLDYWRNVTYKNNDLFKNNLTSSVSGPVFGDELQYLYDLDEMGEFPMIREQVRNRSLSFSRNMVKMWVNFAIFGKPNEDWKGISNGGKLSWYQLKDGMTNVDDVWGKDLDFWDSMFNLEQVIPLPPLLPRNSSRRLQNDDGGSFDDIIYLDQEGDDDGTGGLFEPVV